MQETIPREGRYMSDKAFVDTNIFVYARDKGAGDKHGKAEELVSKLWETRGGRISVQVLNEYFVTVTQKLKPGLPPDDAWAEMVLLRSWEPVPMDWKLIERGRSIFKQHKLSWWDALIVAAAQSAACNILYSEDLADKQIIDGVRIVNPFAGGR
jgi:predicted nucleic acid-binding protein